MYRILFILLYFSINSIKNNTINYEEKSVFKVYEIIEELQKDDVVGYYFNHSTTPSFSNDLNNAIDYCKLHNINYIQLQAIKEKVCNKISFKILKFIIKNFNTIILVLVLILTAYNLNLYQDEKINKSKDKVKKLFDDDYTVEKLKLLFGNYKDADDIEILQIKQAREKYPEYYSSLVLTLMNNTNNTQFISPLCKMDSTRTKTSSFKISATKTQAKHSNTARYTKAATSSLILSPITNTKSKTLVIVNTPTPIPISSASYTGSNSIIPTNTETYTNTKSASDTKSNSIVVTNSETPILTKTRTNTESNSIISTNSATNSDSETAMPTKSRTNTGSNSIISTKSASDTKSNSIVVTNSETPILTKTRTNTESNSIISTNSATNSDSETAMPTNSRTNTGSNSIISTKSASAIPTKSASDTKSNSIIPTNTETYTNTKSASDTKSNSIVVTNSETPILTKTRTNTESNSIISTNSATNSDSETAMPTNSRTNTGSNSIISTKSASAIPTKSASDTKSNSIIPTNSATNSDSETAMLTNSASDTGSNSIIPTNSETPIQTKIRTYTDSETEAILINSATNTKSFSQTKFKTSCSIDPCSNSVDSQDIRGTECTLGPNAGKRCNICECAKKFLFDNTITNTASLISFIRGNSAISANPDQFNLASISTHSIYNCPTYCYTHSSNGVISLLVNETAVPSNALINQITNNFNNDYSNFANDNIFISVILIGQIIHDFQYIYTEKALLHRASDYIIKEYNTLTTTTKTNSENINMLYTPTGVSNTITKIAFLYQNFGIYGSLCAFDPCVAKFPRIVEDIPCSADPCSNNINSQDIRGTECAFGPNTGKHCNICECAASFLSSNGINNIAQLITFIDARIFVEGFGTTDYIRVSINDANSPLYSCPIYCYMTSLGANNANLIPNPDVILTRNLIMQTTNNFNEDYTGYGSNSQTRVILALVTQMIDNLRFIFTEEYLQHNDFDYILKPMNTFNFNPPLSYGGENMHSLYTPTGIARNLFKYAFYIINSSPIVNCNGASPCYSKLSIIGGSTTTTLPPTTTTPSTTPPTAPPACSADPCSNNNINSNDIRGTECTFGPNAGKRCNICECAASFLSSNGINNIAQLITFIDARISFIDSGVTNYIRVRLTDPALQTCPIYCYMTSLGANNANLIPNPNVILTRNLIEQTTNNFNENYTGYASNSQTRAVLALVTQMIDNLRFIFTEEYLQHNNLYFVLKPMNTFNFNSPIMGGGDPVLTYTPNGVARNGFRYVFHIQFNMGSTLVCDGNNYPCYSKLLN